MHILDILNQVVTRTDTATLRDQSQVENDLNTLGFAASKLWNVGWWFCGRV